MTPLQQPAHAPVAFSPRWDATFPGGHVGLLLLGPVDNSAAAPALDGYKQALVAEVRQEYGNLSRTELQAAPILGAYRDYYRGFKKTYHVQLQLESVAHKGKGLPDVNPLVDACFAAELETHLLTASHDADLLVDPVTVTASTGAEILPLMTGGEKQIKAGDMLMRDGRGPICTIIYGQDRRTAVTPRTRRVLYVTYAPAPITAGDVARHQRTLLANVRRFAPEAIVELDRIVTAAKP